MSNDPHIVQFEDVKAALATLGIATKDLRAVSFRSGFIEVERMRRDPERDSLVVIDGLNEMATETVIIRVEHAPRAVQG